METICFTQDEKLYIQIYNYFVNEIEAKRIYPGDKLPSMRKLADHIGVSLNTVKTAYEMLLDEGYIIARERSGYYVDKILSEDFPNLDGSKLHGEILDYRPTPDKHYKYNFKYSLTDNSKIPISVIQKCAQAAVAQSIAAVDSPDEGIWELRVEIAKYLKERRAVRISPENIIVTSGFEENLFILSSLLENPIFALESPGYTRLSLSLSSLGQEYIYIPIDSYGFSVKDLEKTSANVVITSPNHQFPSGLITGIRRRQRLLNWAKEDKRRFIVEDDYNSDFKYTGRPIPALKSMDESGSVLLCGSFSQSIGKFLGISYLVLADRLKQNAPQLALQAVSPLLQYTLKEFLARGYFEKHLNRMNTFYNRKRRKFLKAVKQEKHVEVFGSDAGLHLIVKLDPAYYDLEHFEDIMSENAVYAERVSQYAQGPWPDDEIILGFAGIEEDKIEEAVAYFFRILRK